MPFTHAELLFLQSCLKEIDKLRALSAHDREKLYWPTRLKIATLIQETQEKGIQSNAQPHN